MTLAHTREHNGITLYGYVYTQFGDVPFWSMRFYPESWDRHIDDIKNLPVYNGVL